MTRLRMAFVPLVLLAAAALAAPAAAQGTDFSGTWRLDADASELPDFGGGGRLFGGGGRGPGGGGRGFGGGGRGPGGGGRGGFGLGGARTVVIVQTPAMLIIEQQSDRGSRAATYRLDGEESTSSGPRGEQTSRSRWDGAALVTDGAQSVDTPRGSFTLEFSERRTLSADGETMTVETTRSTPRGDIDTTLVYRRE